MARTLEWLLSLERVKLGGDSAVEWHWQEPLEAWLWFVLFVVVGVYVLVTYRRERGGRFVRAVLGVLRAGVILLAILLLCQPALVHRRDRVEPSTVAILLDASASMGQRDHYPRDAWQAIADLVPDQTPVTTCTRWDLVHGVLRHRDHAVLADLLQHHQLRFFKFAGALSTETVTTDLAGASAFIERCQADPPSGQVTRLSDCLKQTLDANIDAHLTAVVLITDGQPTQQEDLGEVARMLNTRGAPLYVITTGSDRPPLDVALEDLRSDSHVYVGDQVVVQFKVRSTAVPKSLPFEVTLSTAGQDQPLASKRLFAAKVGDEQSVELQFEAREVGPLQLVLELPAVAGELDLSNNIQQLRIQVVDDQVKVLYVDGYPRFEYRYLKNTLLREPSIRSSVLLLSADPAFVQEGSDPIRRFPNSIEELQDYDVVLFGDVDPQEGWITEAQFDLLVGLVSDQGAGFGIIAGPRFAPQRFQGTPIAALIPVELGAAADPAGRLTNRAYRPEITPAGRESPILRLSEDRDTDFDLFQRLPDLYWCNTIPGVKPGAEILLQHPDPVASRLVPGAEGPMPVLAVGRYGAGLTLYQGTDDTWRWRRYRGEAFFDAYWLQVVRYLARNKKFLGATPLQLRTNRKRYDPLTPVVISLSVEDPNVALRLPDSVQADIKTARGVHVAQVPLTRLTADPKYFQGRFLPQKAGQLEAVFTPQRYGLDLAEAQRLFEVQRQSLEHLKPEANPTLMDQLAEAAGGKAFRPDSAQQLAGAIPARRYVVPNDIIETIWDSKLALMLFVTLITGEWILRKAKGMV